MSDYQTLYDKISTAPKWWLVEDRREVLDLITTLKVNNDKVEKILDLTGEYGIRYSSRGDDETLEKEHDIFFSTKERRNAVFKQWEEGKYFDHTFGDYLQYPQNVTSCNFHLKCKVFKREGCVYEEKEESC